MNTPSIPAGKHKAKKIGGELGFTSKDKPQVAVLFQLLDMPDTIVWYGYFSEKTEAGTLKTLNSLGVAPDMANLDAPNDKEFTLVIVHEDDDKGETQAKVRWVNEGNGLALSKPMDPAQRAMFVKQYGAKIAMAGGSKPAATTAQPTNGQKPLPVSQRGDAYDGPEPPADYPF